MGTETGLPSARASRRHRRRHHRHERRLPPHQAGLDRSGADRAGTPVRWHHLARGRPGRQLRATESGTRLVQYSAQLYTELEAETGLATGFKRCGGVTVARTHDRMVQLQRTAATAEAYDLDCELISPERARELYPILETQDLVGAIWLPGDGTANPTDVTQSLARGARIRGARSSKAPGSSASTIATAGSPACTPSRATSRPRWSSIAPGSGPRRSGHWPA